MKKNVISKLYFEVHLVEHCNLNCKGCAHFSPLAIPEFLDINSYRNDLERLRELTDGDIFRITLLGGEPLLHPDIEDFILLSRLYFPNSVIRLITNGIKLVSMPQSFFDACLENKVLIEVTKYPIDFDYDRMLNVLDKSGVDYRYRANTENEEKKFWHLRLDRNGLQIPEESFEKCQWGNGAICLVKGKLFSCPIPAYINHFNRYFNENLQFCESDYVDLYSVKDEKEIRERLSRPMNFCRYCKVEGDGQIYDCKYGKSNRDIEEWT